MQTVLLCEYYARFRGRNKDDYQPSSRFLALCQMVSITYTLRLVYVFLANISSYRYLDFTLRRSQKHLVAIQSAGTRGYTWSPAEGSWLLAFCLVSTACAIMSNRTLLCWAWRPWPLQNSKSPCPRAQPRPGRPEMPKLGLPLTCRQSG